MSPLSEIIDVFFNGRPYKAKTGVTIADLIERKKSVITLDGKLYRITVEELDASKLKTKEGKP